MLVEEWIERLQSLDPKETICIHLWQLSDVFEKSVDMDIEITEKEAREILSDIQDTIDSELGVSWTTIEQGIQNFIGLKI